MRILIVAANPLGGIRTYMLYNFRPMQEAGHRFTFVAPAGEPFEIFKRDLAGWEGVEFVDSNASATFGSIAAAVRRVLRTRDREIGLIHSQGLRAGTESSLGNLLTGRPHFITLHDVIVPENDLPGRFKAIKRKVIGELTRRATVIIPVSKDCATNHLELFPCWRRGPCRIHPILNGIDTARLCASRDRVEKEGNNLPANRRREDLKIEKNIVLGGFFGRLMPQKGFLPLLDACRELHRRGLGKRFHLLAANDPHGLNREYVGAVEQSPELASMVTWIDPVADIAPLFAQVDLLVMPSLWEACGLLAMEAMVLGVPVVGSDCIGLREVLHDTPALTPTAGDFRALADSLERFIREQEGLTQAARTFATTARERFDIAESLHALRLLYKEAEERVAAS